MRARIVLGSLLGAMLIHGVFIACGEVGMEITDGSLTSARADHGGATPRPMESACDKTVASNGFTYYHAEFSVPGFDPRNGPEVSARICQFACTLPTCSFSSLPGGTDYICSNVGSIWLKPGRIDVVCGIEQDRARVARIWIH